MSTTKETRMLGVVAMRGT